MGAQQSKSQPYICQMHSGKAVYDFLVPVCCGDKCEIMLCELNFVDFTCIAWF